MMRITRVLIISVLLSSCLGDDTDFDFSLPKPTQEGKNTFGCILNDHVWINYGKQCFLLADGCHENLIAIYRSANNGRLDLYADRVIRKKGSLVSSETISFSLDGNFNAAGNYSLRYVDHVSDIGYRNNLTEKTYGCLPNRETFTLQITKLDTLEKIISGKFSGTLFNIIYDPLQSRPGTDSITIRDGRFDVRFK